MRRFIVFNVFLNAGRLWNFTMLGGKLFHTVTTRSAKKFCRRLVWQLLDKILYGLPRVVETVGGRNEKYLSDCTSTKPKIILYVKVRSSSSRLYSKLRRFSFTNLAG